MHRLWTTCLIALTLVACSSAKKESSLRHPSTVSLALSDDMETLDPRKCSGLESCTVHSMLFEGLFVSSNEGARPALAESYSVSEDGKTYTFHLRPTFWSNGEPVTAHDFEYTWKSILEPKFPAPMVDMLFVIKNAQEAKHGLVAMEDVGVKALDDHTLEVRLVNPHPQFLEILCIRTFLPVSRAWDQNKSKSLIGNGPYLLREWRPQYSLYLEKSPTYWDAASIQLPAVEFMIVKEGTALELFEKGEMDWVGSPLSTLPNDSLDSLRERGLLRTAPAAAVHFIRANTSHPLLSSSKIRRALAYALDRETLTKEVLRAEQQPAEGLVPPVSGHRATPLFHDNTVERARELLKEGLAEAGMTLESMPTLTLLYGGDETRHQLAQSLQQQWRQTLGLPINLERMEKMVVLERCRKLDYDLCLGCWYGDVADPMNFLNIFRTKDMASNRTLWENSLYTSLLQRAERENHPAKRKVLQQQAERMLMREMPCIPLYFATYSYAQSNKVAGIFLLPQGVLYFHEAHLTRASR